mgnify:CR=1 FL=1
MIAGETSRFLLMEDGQARKAIHAKARMRKKILGQVRRAVQDYSMIREGDRIAVGVSGGKDSLTLLVALKYLRDFYPEEFELEAITLTLGIGEADFSPIQDLCKSLRIAYTIEDTLIGKIVFEAKNEKNPCSLCANMKRGALHNAAKRLGCNKVALGHNRDDVIETLMSLFYEGRIHTFSPVTYLDRKDIFVIRPLIYSEEKDIKGFIKSQGIATIPSPCRITGNTSRKLIENYLSEIQAEIPMIKDNIFGAIRRSGIDGWDLRHKDKHRRHYEY